MRMAKRIRWIALTCAQPPWSHDELERLVTGRSGAGGFRGRGSSTTEWAIVRVLRRVMVSG